MPAFAIADGARYAVDGEALGELAAWYAQRQPGAAARPGKRLIAHKLDAPPVRCWPHHFDLDTLIYFDRKEPVRTMGVGFSPGDEYYDEPYFYVSIYPAPDVADAAAAAGDRPLARARFHGGGGAREPDRRVKGSARRRSNVYLEAAIEVAIDALSRGRRSHQILLGDGGAELVVVGDEFAR